MTPIATLTERYDDDPQTRRPAVEPEPATAGAGEVAARALVPFDARTTGIIAIAVIAAGFALYAGASFFIPLAVSLFLSYALSPVVDRFERLRLPRALSAAIALVLAIVVSVLGLQLALSGATEVLEDLPRAVQKARLAVYSWERDDRGALKQMRKTADELQKLAGATTSAVTATPAPATPAPGTAPPPPAAEPKLPFTVTLNMAIFLGQLASVIFLTYFLLAAGDLFRRRTMQLAGPSMASRRKTLDILRQVHAVSQRYFALVFLLNVLAGFVTALGVWAIGVHHPLFWGIAMAVLHTVPYIGAAVVAITLGLIAYIQLDSLTVAIAAASVPVAVSLVVGMWLQTALLGRATGMNAVVVFVALLFWGMVWGGWGLLLAFPIMAALKIVFAEVERLKPLATLMSD